MRLMRWTLLVVLAVFTVRDAEAQLNDSHNYPSDEEINLLMSQADRGMALYEQVVAQEVKLLGNSASAGTDMKLLEAWKSVRGALGKDPQKFNSFAGFDIVTIIDDAARNVAIISGSAGGELLQQVMAGKTNGDSDSLITLMGNSNSAGTLLYTVAESASALYLRFLHWQDSTLQESVKALAKCANMTKKP